MGERRRRRRGEQSEVGQESGRRRQACKGERNWKGSSGEVRCGAQHSTAPAVVFAPTSRLAFQPKSSPTRPTALHCTALALLLALAWSSVGNSALGLQNHWPIRDCAAARKWRTRRAHRSSAAALRRLDPPSRAGSRFFHPLPRLQTAGHPSTRLPNTTTLYQAGCVSDRSTHPLAGRRASLLLLCIPTQACCNGFARMWRRVHASRDLCSILHPVTILRPSQPARLCRRHGSHMLNRA